jgi:outer membrane receptor protein involved in Fe transport
MATKMKKIKKQLAEWICYARYFIFIPPLSPADTVPVYELPPVTVVASLKQAVVYAEQPLSFTSIDREDLEASRIAEPKNLSLNVPNFLHADYGARMTGSIYIRGIGSRMEQPAAGLYVDNVPVLNKNNFDFDYLDIERIDVLRGPQGTLYGRNAVGGVMDVHTLSPAAYQGTRLQAGYGNGNAWKLQASTYQKPTERFAFSVALKHSSGDGFQTNSFDGSPADRFLNESGRVKIQLRLSPEWKMENSLSAGFVKQAGFAYSLYDEETKQAMPVNHNDPCTYVRLGLTDGLTFQYAGNVVRFSSTTSYQRTDDEMVLDQDFRPVSMFTLSQAQRENAFTQEFVVRPAQKKKWQWISGAFGFYRHVDMEAPVMFKKDGIDELILANANAGIQAVFPEAALLIKETRFPVESYFDLPAYGFSLYHQSTFVAGRWEFTGGMRADFEHAAIAYAGSTAISYRFSMTMPDYKPLSVAMPVRRHDSFFEILPKVAVAYQTGIGKLYASAARGYKTGGFNTQIFSDILQNRMMNALMSDLGVYLNGSEPPYNAETAVSYAPEYIWNHEAGGHFKLLGEQLSVDAAVFYIDCRNQQLTVFPPGKTTGRLMSNAGHTQIFGGELSAGYRYKNIRFKGNYGYTHATFLRYSSGNEDYAGNRAPYAPTNTLSLHGGYKWDVSRKRAGSILLDVSLHGAGKIYWSESNTVYQPFYGLLNADITFQTGSFGCGLWAKNLTGTDYNTFYFKSVGRSFVQQGKPVQLGAFISLIL